MHYQCKLRPITKDQIINPSFQTDVCQIFNILTALLFKIPSIYYI